ncbi:hypothetical protein F4811DRAFT_529111 [Daldinia bambusicola]|nr:hypothetical protein F4811DRAFT_529111 [Daldinia bambusicola]
MQEINRINNNHNKKEKIFSTMRSRPYTPPPALPPLLAELSAFLPNRDRRSDEGDRTAAAAGALYDPDPETSRLLPVQQERPQHCVRVQGRLAPVRSVSVAATPRSTSQTRFDAAVSGTAARARVRRRRSSDDLHQRVYVHAHVLSTSREEEAGSERDAQLRGYGIGGRGNIRRPTDVIGTQSSSASSLSALSLFSGPSSAHRSYSGAGAGADSSKKFSLSGILNRIEERRGRERNARI